MIKHPFVQLIAITWLFATIACFATKNDSPIQGAAIFSICAGLGYVLCRPIK
jgi:hypothetical protein